jgi:hypothetical protein
MKKGLRCLLSGLAAGVYFFSTGCNDKIRVPSVVPVYSERSEEPPIFYYLDEDARFHFNGFIDHAIYSDFEKALPKILAVVDSDGNRRIGHFEAYEAINIYRPVFRDFIERLNASRDEYATNLKVQDGVNVSNGVDSAAAKSGNPGQVVPVSVNSIGE